MSQLFAGRKLHEAGCIQTLCDCYTDVNEAMDKGYQRFCALMVLIGFNPCNECPIPKNKYNAYQQYHSAPQTRKIAKQ